MKLISAGHHKKAEGARFGDVTEYQLSTKWADRIAEIMGDQCVRVPNGTLKEKVAFINQFDRKSIAIDIHFNSFKMWKDQNANGVVDDGEMVHAGRGSETLYYPSSKTGEKAARIMQGSISQVFKPDRGIKEGYYQMNKSKGVDFFLARTSCTSLIIEPEFIDNLETLDQNMDSCCHAIASALLDIEKELF